ncbi:MAG: AraC family transcriptional regulator [Gemmataceae bacterium]|nr:AraC family transcriptional regulator [Gemmataceae bacterium]
MKTDFQRRPIEVTLASYGVFVLESHHAPGFRMAAQRHDFLEIFYVLEGSGTFFIDGQPHACHQRDIVVVPVGAVHRIEDNPASPLALYGICITPRVWQHETALADHLCAGRLPIGKLAAAQVRDDLRRMLFEQRLARPGSGTLVLGLALQLLAVLVQSQRHTTRAQPSSAGDASASHRQAVERYVADLEQRFFEATDLDHVAAELHISRRSFTSLFRNVTGTSWSAYLTRLRINYARQLLRDTSRRIIAIAFECGYEDLSSFYRAFKRQTRTPPGVWRSKKSGVRGQGSEVRRQESEV